MGFLTAFFIALGLAMDAFAVSLGIGTTGQAQDGHARFRLSFHFGFFQFGMTIVGWLAGSTISRWIEGIDHWVALILLLYVGLNMIRSGLNPDCECYPCDPSRGKTLMMLCVATSLDALAVGLSMAMLRTPVLLPSILIGVVASSLSIIGLHAGGKMQEAFGKRMEVLGGLILVGIGVRVVLNALL
jgi:putative Mn2+ efflux pump MntP